jgi:nitroreductase
MNTKLEVIFSRRSVRKFQNKPVGDEMVNDLLEAAMAAPSAVAKDPWHFIVLRRRETIDRIAEILPHGKMLNQAPAAIIVCGDLDRAHSGELSYLLQDLSASVENLLLAANILGLGACWLGVHPREERQAGIREMFGLPETIIPMCGIALGWPAEKPETRTRFNPEKVHLEKW